MTYSKEDLKALKKDVKAKFRTLKHFAYSSGMEYPMLNKFFGRKLGAMQMDEVKGQILNLVSSTEVKPFLHQIQPEDREFIRRKIMMNYKSMNHFITDNPQFSKSFMSNIINGKRKNKDLRYKILRDAVMNLQVNPMEVVVE
jgi:hypothetical protein